MALDPYERLDRDGSLGAALESIAAEFTASAAPGAIAIYDRLLAWLRSGAIGREAPRIGEPFLDFVLPDQDGRLVTLHDLVAGGPVVLSFFRGGWCPYCGLEMAAIERARPEIVAAGGQIVGITPEILGYPRETMELRRLGYRLLVDIDNGLALSLGIVFQLPSDVVEAYKSRGLDLELRQGNGAWMVPVPATFVIDREAMVRLAFVEPDYRVRLDPRALIDAVKTL